MATVYLGRVTGMAGFEREVAIKLTHEHLRAEPKFTTALIDEANFAGRIRHPNVVSVLDVAEYRHGVFIVMDYVEGQSLAGIQAALRGQPVPVEIALKILDDILTGLHAAHELRDPSGAPLDLVHRDVTPHNVLLGIDGVARLTDFGIAKAAGRLTMTQTGLVKGKLAYMSPEQARAQPLDRRCDVWAAGIIAWELMSGRRIHEGVDDAALLFKIVREPPTPLRHVRPELPPELDRAIAGALQLEASKRHPTAEAFAEILLRSARASGIAPADARGVRDFISPFVERTLAERRAKLADIHARRREGRPSLPDEDFPLESAAAPSSSRGLAAGLVPAPESLDSAESTSPPSDSTVWSGPLDAAPSAAQTQTGTLGAGVFPDGRVRHSQIPRASALDLLRRHPALWVVALTGLLIVVALGVFSMLRSARATAGTEPNGAAVAGQPLATSAPTTGTTTAADAASAGEIPVFDLSTLPAVPGPPSETAPTTSAEPKLKRPPIPKPATTTDPAEPTPLGNPY